MSSAVCDDFLAETLAIAIEPTYFDLEQYEVNPREIVALVRRARANALRVGMFSHQGHAYYQSQVAPHAPGLGTRDLLAEFQEECTRESIHLIVYSNSKYDTQAYAAHPDQAIRVRGKVAPHPGAAGLDLYPMCPNSAYLGYYQRILREIVHNYQPDTMYIDNFGLVFHCQCPSCRAQFREHSGGMDPPATVAWDDPLWQQYRRWVCAMNFQRGLELVAAIRQERPGMPVVFNRGPSWTGFGDRSPEDLYRFAHEIANNVHAESAVRFHGDPFTHINEQCILGQAIDTSIWTWVEYPMQPWSYLSCPPAELRIKAAKVLANGGRPMVWSIPRAPDGDERGVAGLADVFGLVRDHPQCFNGCRHLPFAAVLCSSQTMQETARGDAARVARYRAAFNGALEILIHAHLPFGAVLDGHLTTGRLSDYTVLVLPNAAALSDAQCAAVADFVRAGGGLIATFETSLYNERGQQREDFGLAEVLGAGYEGALGPQTVGRSAGYAAVSRSHPVTSAIPPGVHLPQPGHHLHVRAHEEVEVLAWLLRRCRYYCDHLGPRTAFPALLANTCGRGRVVYIPGEFFQGYHERGFVEYRSLMQAAVAWVAHGRVPLQTTLPDTVEVTVTASRSDQTIIHLVNCSADLTRPVTAVIPVRGHQLSLQTDRAPEAVRVLRTGERLECRYAAGYVTIDVPPLAEYEVVIVENQR